jgi:hypothetical protein
MATDETGPPAAPRDRRTSLFVALAIVAALLVFLAGYLVGRGPREAAASPSTSATIAPAPTTITPTPTVTVSVSVEPTASAAVSEPAADRLPDGTYFVRLTELQGGENGPPVVVYDLAYFLTGEQANQAAADQGMETPVPDGYFIVNDNPKLRHAPLAADFSAKYLPEGAGLSTPVKAHQSQFLGWLGGTVQTDFPSIDTSWWWITIDQGQITTIKQQYLP